MNLEVFNETDEDLNLELKELQELLEKTCKDEGLDNGEFNVIIVGEEKIRELNREYRNIDKVTDVISFALEDYEDVKLPYRLLGDIYISIDKAITQAIEYNGYTTKEILTTPVNCESSEHKLKVSTNNGSLRVFDTNFA